MLIGSDYVTLVTFMTGQFPFKYGQFVCAACQKVVFQYLTTTVLPEKTVTVSDNMGSVSEKL